MFERAIREGVREGLDRSGIDETLSDLRMHAELLGYITACRHCWKAVPNKARLRRLINEKREEANFIAAKHGWPFLPPAIEAEGGSDKNEEASGQETSETA